MNPMIVAQARTARLVREATTPVYSTDTVSAARAAREALLSEAEQTLCDEDYCFVCGRCTDHFGEHSEEPLLAAGNRRSRFLR